MDVRGRCSTSSTQSVPPQEPPAKKCCGEARASGETPNLAVQPTGAKFGKPEVAVWPGRKELWDVRSRWEREPAELASRADTPDLAALPVVHIKPFSKPEVAVRPDRDAERVATRRG